MGPSFKERETPVQDELFVSEAYVVLNEIIANAIFNENYANQPVYVEISDEARVEIASKLKIKLDELDGYIFDTVIQNFENMHSIVNKAQFGPFVIHQKTWIDNGFAGNFPNLPLLMTFSITAGDMGATGGFSSNAYYPRLLACYQLQDLDHLADSYRDNSQFFWGYLNFWLDEILKGSRGIGTAYSISTHKHVGLAFSQALVRSIDRQKLPRLFRKNGFAPFTSLVDNDMEKVLDDWVNNEDSYQNSTKNPSKLFKNLWQKPEAKKRISSIICRELELWDGSVRNLGGSNSEIDSIDFDVRLELSINYFPSKSLDFNFSVSSPVEIINEEISLRVEDSESSLSIKVRRDLGDWFTPDVSKLPIENTELLGGVLNISINKVHELVRQPKNLVIFRIDELTKKFYEVERLEIGTRSIIFFKGKTEIYEKIEIILEQNARMGWNKLNPRDFHGIPEGWVMYNNVELLQIPTLEQLSKFNILEALKPTFSGTLTISQGLQLPGRPPKWHSDSQIEIRATVVGAERIELQIVDSFDSETTIDKKEFIGSTGIWLLSGLTDGNYIINLNVNSDNKNITRKNLLLRSADTKDNNMWDSSERLIHDLSTTNAALINSQIQIHDSLFFVDGALTVKPENQMVKEIEVQFENKIWWGQAQSTDLISSEFKLFKLLKASEASCFNTGAHRIPLPPALPSKNRKSLAYPKTKYIEGVCDFCGIRKKSAAIGYVAEKSKDLKRLKLKGNNIVDSLIPTTKISDVMQINDVRISWDTALDSVMHVGGGSIGYLDTIAINIDPSPLFRYQFKRQLDSLAYIDLKFDDYYDEMSWEVSPTFLVKSEHDWFLTGFVSKSLWLKLTKLLDSSQYERESIQNSFTRYSLKNLNDDDLEVITAGLEVRYAEDAANMMLDALPNIIDTSNDLIPKPFMGYDVAFKYNVEADKWIETIDVLTPGAYRLRKSYKDKYVIRNLSDTENRTVRYVSAEFAKHFASSLVGRALASYDPKNRFLIVPKGALLPGLFGRAAALVSGHLPTLDKTNRYIVYPNITQKFANKIGSKLSSNV
jgi:hypothetical protein